MKNMRLSAVVAFVLVGACTVNSETSEPCDVPDATAIADSGTTDSGTEADANANVTPSSEFDQDSDGWTIIGDATEVEASWQGEGGNPGGLIAADDSVSGGVWYFKAPQKFLGDRSSAYGRSLTYDLRIDAPPSDPFDDVDVIVSGAGIKLVFDTEPVPGTTWTSYAVPLIETAGWHKDTLSGEAPTAEEFRAVLSAVDDLRIRGEFNTGPDTGFLDNPVFGGEDQ